MKKISTLVIISMILGYSIAGYTETRKVKPTSKQNKISKVELDVSDKTLSTLENTVPSKDYAFYVASNSAPKTVADLQQITMCTGEDIANRAIYIAMSLNISSFANGSATQECIAGALKANPKSVVVTQRNTNLPLKLKLSELVFR